MKTWREIYPHGRHVFYEGDDPAGFAKEMLEKFGFDPSKDNDHWNEESGYGFFVPGEHINEVYGVAEYPLGS